MNVFTQSAHLERSKRTSWIKLTFNDIGPDKLLHECMTAVEGSTSEEHFNISLENCICHYFQYNKE